MSDEVKLSELKKRLSKTPIGFGRNAAGDLTLNGRTAAEDWASLTKDIATCLADLSAKRGRPVDADCYLYHLRGRGRPAVNQVDSNNKMINVVEKAPVPKADEETSEAEKAEAGGETSEPATTTTDAEKAKGDGETSEATATTTRKRPRLP